MFKLIAFLFPALRGPALRPMALAGALALACALVGCAGLPPRSLVPETPTLAIAASASTELGRAATSLNSPPDGLSSMRPLIEASFALDARLELMRLATSSLDI